MDIKSCIKKRASYKARLTQFKKYLDIIESCERLSGPQNTQLSTRLIKIEELYSEFDSIQTEIEMLADMPDDQFAERENFETLYFDTIACAKDILSKCEVNVEAPGSCNQSVSGSCCKQGGGPRLKLPTIHLPTFSGQYGDWLEFHDTFSSLIHTDHSIPKINKFHYLRASLKDSASLIIQSIDFTADNYDIAWDLLCDRYNNKRLLINHHIQAIFSINQLHRETASSLRSLIDTVNKNLRALNILGLHTEHWDMIIIHIVSSKLDAVTNREWETHRSDIKALPTLQDLNSFLKNRCDLLETIEEQVSRTKPKQSGTPIRHKAFISNQITCPLCKFNHGIYNCQKFKSLSIEARIQRARFLNLCLNCLRQGHSTRTCKSRKCRFCNKSHNSLLHINTQDSSIESPKSASNSKSNHFVAPATNHTQNTGSNGNDQFTQPVALSAIHKKRHNVLLSTALINIKDSMGNTHTVRALLDNGSTSCFIKEDLCAKLNLPTTSTTSSIVEGLSGQITHLSKTCDVDISSRLGSYKENINCFVVPLITQSLPTTRINLKSFNIPQNITLADPNFYVPGDVQILLGANIFWNILGTKRIKLGSNKPIFSESSLGWLVSGTVETHNTNNTVHCNHNILLTSCEPNNQNIFTNVKF